MHSAMLEEVTQYSHIALRSIFQPWVFIVTLILLLHNGFGRGVAYSFHSVSAVRLGAYHSFNIFLEF